MSRKAPTFGQLASYIGQGSASVGTNYFSRNLYYSGGDQNTVSKIFSGNYRFLPHRKNGNALYHEVLVLPPQLHLSRPRQREILHAIADKYCEFRAPQQMVWGKAHFDTDYPHIHLMISANEIRSNRRKRLTKKNFSDIQRALEVYKEQKFPELKDERVYNKQVKQRKKIKSSEGELVRRTGKPSLKDEVFKDVRYAIEHSDSLSNFRQHLRQGSLELYKRGRNWGVKNTISGKRYRLKTLGLDHTAKHLFSKTPTRSNDLRAQAMLERRESLKAHAREQLSDFENDCLGKDER